MRACYMKIRVVEKGRDRLQTTLLTSGGSVTAITNCCENWVVTSHPSHGDPIYRFLGKPAMPTR